VADRIIAELEDAALRTILDGLGASAQPYVNAASKETAVAIAREAKARLHRQLGPNATGATEAHIAARPAFDANGYIVISEREPFPNVPLWLEKGTKKGASSHANYARPFFYVSAEIEAGAHYRRIGEALQQAIDAKGLGS
jgi:hypothetical protein